MFLLCRFQSPVPRAVGEILRRRFGLLAVVVALLGLGFGGCAQRPQEVAASHGKEYFPESVYGRASRRVIADGQPVPRGGGQYLVGKPYTIAGRTYYPSESRRTQVGYASWYGDAFHGRLTANGEIYDRDSLTAASPTMPLPCYARVTNLRNNTSMIVRVNDRGPYASDRIMDVSRRVAEALDFKRYGTAKLKVEYVARASLAGSDDAKLYATLRAGGPARWHESEPTMVAEAAPPARVASIAPFVPQPSRRVRAEDSRARDEDDDDMPKRRTWSEDDGRPRHSRHVASDEPGRGMHGYDPAPTGSASHRASKAKGSSDAKSWAEETRLALARSHKPGRIHAEEPRPVRVAHATDRHTVLPPSRPMDLGTIPGAASQIRSSAGSQIRAHHERPHLRMARVRDE